MCVAYIKSNCYFLILHTIKNFIAILTIIKANKYKRETYTAGNRR